tara:strand:- start:294 stop:494 length:201 start_codon:yes stop_codon:yes gene_type:complete
MAKKKGKAKPQVSLTHDPNKIDPDPKCQFKVEKAVEDDKKVRPQQVFEGYKVPSASKKAKGKSGKK